MHFGILVFTGGICAPDTVLESGMVKGGHPLHGKIIGYGIVE